MTWKAICASVILYYLKRTFCSQKTGQKIHIDTIVSVFFAAQLLTVKWESDSKWIWLRDLQPAQHLIRAALFHPVCSQVMILNRILWFKIYSHLPQKHVFLFPCVKVVAIEEFVLFYSTCSTIYCFNLILSAYQNTASFWGRWGKGVGGRVLGVFLLSFKRERTSFPLQFMSLTELNAVLVSSSVHSGLSRKYNLPFNRKKSNFPFFSREYFYEVIFSLHCSSAVNNPFTVE